MARHPWPAILCISDWKGNISRNRFTRSLSEIPSDSPYAFFSSRHLPNDYVKHNFFKYLVNRKGIAVKLFTKKEEPLSIQDAIEELLEDEVPKKLTTE